MKVFVDNEFLFELNETQKKVLCHELHNEILNEDLKRRLQWVLQHKYEQCFKRLKAEWEPKLKANGVKAIPLDNDEFAQLAFSQPEYKDRAARVSEGIQ